MSDTFTRLVQYDKLSKLSTDDLKNIKHIHVLFDETDPKSVMAKLAVTVDGKINRVEQYESLKEFSTVAMKELLMLYAKRSIIDSDTEYYTQDDPKLHSFLSKLSYSGVEAVCHNLSEFSTQFKSGKVTLKLLRSGTTRPNLKRPMKTNTSN
jgi:hypothetical protein